MTMHYSSADEEYIRAMVAYHEQQRRFEKSKRIETTNTNTHVPDYDEAERIWKLLVDAAQN